MIQRRDPPLRLGASPIGMKNFVARTTSSRRPLSAFPTISSDSPDEYTSAESTKLAPASRARWMMRIESSWSGVPQAPNIMVPRHSFETSTPVRPSGRYSMLVPWSEVSSVGAGRAVLLVGDVLAPGDGAAGLVLLLHGDVGHEAVRGGAVPIVLARLEE